MIIRFVIWDRKVTFKLSKVILTAVGSELFYGGACQEVSTEVNYN